MNEPSSQKQKSNVENEPDKNKVQDKHVTLQGNEASLYKVRYSLCGVTAEVTAKIESYRN
jgi:hypothetical protein